MSEGKGLVHKADAASGLRREGPQPREQIARLVDPRLQGLAPLKDGCTCDNCDRWRSAFARADAILAITGEPWPISTDGPHRISDRRRWLARQLMDSKNTDEEAFGIVRGALAP